MSMKRTVAITCPNCGEAQFMQLWSVLTAGDNEAWHALNIAGLNIFQCSKCRFRSFVDEPVLYEDPEHRFAIQYVSGPAETSDAFLANYTREGRFVLNEGQAALLKQQGKDYLLRPFLVFSIPCLKRMANFLRRCAKNGLDPAGPFTKVKAPPDMRFAAPLLDAGNPPLVSKQLQLARQYLSDAQLATFFHAAHEYSRVRALDDVCKHLDDSLPLDDFFSIFEPESSQPFDAKAPIETWLRRFTVELTVVPLAEFAFSITFGFHGMDSGDGGTWLVVYDKQGGLLKCAETDQYIH